MSKNKNRTHKCTRKFKNDSEKFLCYVIEALTAWSKDGKNKSFVLIAGNNDDTHVAWSNLKHLSFHSYDLGLHPDTAAVMDVLSCGADIAYDDQREIDPDWVEKVNQLPVDEETAKWVIFDDDDNCTYTSTASGQNRE